MGCQRQRGRIRTSNRKEQDIVNVNVPVAVAVQTGDQGTSGADQTMVNVAVVLQGDFQNGSRNRIRERESNRIVQR